MSMSWIIGAAVVIGGGYFLLKDKKKETKKNSQRRQLEITFGRMQLAAQRCGPITESTDKTMDALEKVSLGSFGPIEDILRRHCPEAFTVSADDAATMGQLSISAIETAFGIGIIGSELCPELLEGEQIEIFFMQFLQGLTETDPLSAVTTYQSNVLSMCPAIESVTGEEIQRRGKEHMTTKMGFPQ